MLVRESFLAPDLGIPSHNAECESYRATVRDGNLAPAGSSRFTRCWRVTSVNSRAIVVVGARQYAQKPIITFCGAIGATPLAGRFIPGTFTNPRLPQYTEPELVLITDPRADYQSVKETAKIRIPTIALVDTDNSLSFIDLAIPANNKGRQSLALVFWLLTREVLKERGELTPDTEFSLRPEDFVAMLRRTE